MSVFSFVGFCNAEYKSSFLLSLISVAQGYSPEDRVCLNEPLKYIEAKIKAHLKDRQRENGHPEIKSIFCPNSLLTYVDVSIF